MKVHLKRTGGLAGLAKEWELDERRLGSGQRAELKGLLQAAKFFSLPSQTGSLAGAPDQFIYELTVEDQGQRRTVCCQERAVSSELRQCLEWITTAVDRTA